VSKFDRILELHQLFAARHRPVSMDEIRRELACSDSTARRTLRDLRDAFDTPLEYDRERNGWLYTGKLTQRYEIPGLWFSPEELYALLVSHHLLNELQPGLLSRYIDPVKDKLEDLLKKHGGDAPDIARRVRILQMAARPTNLRHFRRFATALLERKRVRVLYHGRERDQTTERVISPQRMVYYRSNWYLDAWCHLRGGLRSFSLDRLHPVDIPDEAAKEISDDVLDKHYAGAYGIFAGKPHAVAVLRFTPNAARWIADEQWHPLQEGKVLKDGGFELRIPYRDARELIMDILKYGPDVRVVSPKRLREAVMEKLAAAVGRYK
jgi:predicted DNA-binding transcriptional regulator YafY